jgi:hypothetical protein
LAPKASASLSGKYESVGYNGHAGGSCLASKSQDLNQSTEEAKQVASLKKKLNKKDFLSYPNLKIIVKSTKTISFDK